MFRPLLLLTALALLAGDVLLYGSWTNRWTSSRELDEAVARLKAAPKELGEWQAEDLELSNREVAQAEIAGYLFRRYKNQRTGEAITILLLCGRSGPMSVHTPDICYRGAGYSQVGGEARTEVLRAGAEQPTKVWSANFAKEGPLTTSRLRISWAWKAQQSWEAPDNPRLAFAGRSALYKLYVVRQLNSSSERAEEELCQDFLSQLLPQLDRVLSSASVSPGSRDAARAAITEAGLLRAH
jgi:hypothetical protein